MPVAYVAVFRDGVELVIGGLIGLIYIVSIDQQGKDTMKRDIEFCHCYASPLATRGTRIIWLVRRLSHASNVALISASGY